MSGGNNKFTARARSVLLVAQRAAERLQQSSIGPEHLLLGLLSVRDGVAAQVLASLGVNLEEARGKVEGIVEGMVEPGARQGSAEVGMTPRGKKVIELAVNEAFQMRHHYIGTEHLLLGLMRAGEGSADSVLNSLGADGLTLMRMRVRTRQVLTARRPMRWGWLPGRRDGGEE